MLSSTMDITKEITLEMFEAGCFNFSNCTLDLTPLTKLPKSKTISRIGFLSDELEFNLVVTPPEMPKKIGYYLGMHEVTERRSLHSGVNYLSIPIFRHGDKYYAKGWERHLKDSNCLIVDDYVESGGYAAGIAQYVRSCGAKCDQALFIFNTRANGIRKLNDNGLAAIHITDYSKILDRLVDNNRIEKETANKMGAYALDSPL